MVQHFGWKRVAVLSSTDNIYALTATEIKLQLIRVGVDAFSQTFEAGYQGISKAKRNKVREILEGVKVRVI